VTGFSTTLDDLPGRYTEYLDRFTREVGDIKFGDFAQYAGRAIRMLSFEEFTETYTEYHELLTRYRDSLERGDTVDDLMLKLMREQSANLVLPTPRL
jgi:hypothetical protein